MPSLFGHSRVRPGEIYRGPQHKSSSLGCETAAGDYFLRGDLIFMSKAVKYAEKAVVYAAKGAWAVFERLNRISPNPSFTPKWSDKPLQKSYEKEKPPLGWPRATDSLCPKCVPEIRKQILDGKLPYEVLLNEKVGEIKAQII